MGTLVAGVFVTLLDAVFGRAFSTPAGFFPFLGAILGFLGGVMAWRGRKNGNGNGSA